MRCKGRDLPRPPGGQSSLSSKTRARVRMKRRLRGSLKLHTRTIRPKAASLLEASSPGPRTSAGRFLIVLWSLLLALMPVTEHFWTFDRFLHGGSQDFELSLLLTITILCLVLLLAQNARLCLSLILAMRRWLRCAFDREDTPASMLREWQASRGEESARTISASSFVLPLRL